MRHVPVALGLCVVVAMLLACSGGGPPSTEKASPELQAKRLELIKGLQREGVVKALESGEGKAAPKLIVTEKFMALEPKSKRTFCDAVFAYAHELRRDATSNDVTGLRELRLIHAVTGKQVGTYHPDSGGLSMD